MWTWFTSTSNWQQCLGHLSRLNVTFRVVWLAWRWKVLCMYYWGTRTYKTDYMHKEHFTPWCHTTRTCSDFYCGVQQVYVAWNHFVEAPSDLIRATRKKFITYSTQTGRFAYVPQTVHSVLYIIVHSILYIMGWCWLCLTELLHFFDV